MVYKREGQGPGPGLLPVELRREDEAAVDHLWTEILLVLTRSCTTSVYFHFELWGEIKTCSERGHLDLHYKSPAVWKGSCE